MENQLLITLSKNKLLKNVDISKIDLSKIKGKLLTINEGNIIYREGDTTEGIYLIINGEINVLKKRLLGQTKSYIYSDNSFFGHEEFLEQTARTSTAVVLRDSYLIQLSNDELSILISQNEDIKTNLLKPTLEEIDDFHEKKNEFTEESQSNEGIEQKTEEHFKTVTKFSIESQPFEESIEPISESSEEVEEFYKDLLNEDGIPKAEVDLTELESNEVENIDEEIQNENKISKPESEVSDKNVEKLDQENIHDALFEILSGLEMPKTEEKQEDEIKEVNKQQRDETISDASFNEHNVVEEKDDQKSISDSEKKEIKTWENFETEEIYEDVDKKLQNLKEQKTVLEDIRDLEQEEIKMKVDQLQMIIKAAELVNSTIKIDEVLKNIVEVATELTEADRGTLYLVDKERGELWSLIAMGSEIKEIRLKIGEGMAGYVAKTGEILNIKDVSKDPRYRSDFDKASGYTTKTALTFPMKNKNGEIIGVLQLLNSKKGEFSKLDEELLNAMSIHSAIALQNAELVEKLLQAERVQSLGKMANFLIQDIKKPILVSKRYAEHLKNKNLSPDNIQIVDMLLEQLNHVADLVQTTSSYSEGKTILRTLNVSLNKTLTDYSTRIETYVESRNCKIINEFDKDVNVKLDVKEFYQCYMHIIKNACDAMPDGGTITISTKKDDKEKKVKIFFSDTGLGIAESLKEKIFEPFFTQGKKEGTGLGLSITKQIVEAHNGKIEVQSALGEGATFIITLPTILSF